MIQLKTILRASEVYVINSTAGNIICKNILAISTCPYVT